MMAAAALQIVPSKHQKTKRFIPVSTIDAQKITALLRRSGVLLFSPSLPHPSPSLFFSKTGLLAIIVTVFFVLGCTPEEPDSASTSREVPLGKPPIRSENAEPLSVPNPNPASSTPYESFNTSSDPAALLLLQRLIEKYRSARTYSDRGTVRLQYSQGGQTFVDQAVLSLVFRRGSSMYCKAYAAEIEIYRGIIQAQLDDPLTGNFDNQILRRKLATPTFGLADVYCDPTLTHFSTAGLGGPSPQLELLLSENPFGGLLQGNVVLSIDPSEMVGDSSCQIVAIQSGNLQYRFWIDSGSMLLRRVELPSEAAGLDQTPTITSVSLTIELSDASWEVPSDVNQTLEKRATGPIVKQFILPPPAPAPLIGKTSANFKLTATDNSFEMSERGSDRPLTILLWIADHPSCELAARELQRLAEQFANDANQPEIRFALIMAEPGTALPGRSLALGKQWQVSLPIIDDYAAIGRDVFGIFEAPTLVVLGENGLIHWLQPRVGPEMSQTIPNLVNDLVAGKSVGEEIRKQYEIDQQTYRKYLLEVRVED